MSELYRAAWFIMLGVVFCVEILAMNWSAAAAWFIVFIAANEKHR